MSRTSEKQKALKSNEKCRNPDVPNSESDYPKKNDDVESAPSSPVTKGDGLEKGRIFNYKELAIATRDFHDDALLGKGRFGFVFKGELNTGEVVAVKRLYPLGLQGEESLVEVLILSLLRHPNLVKTMGYCVEGTQHLLVLEFMPLGSLDCHLHDLPSDKEPLDWNTRIKIAVGVARGVDYLHNEANPPIMFGDLNPSNILLDKGFNPKLSDFGLRKFCPVSDSSHASTRVMDTYGYCAPEYTSFGKLTLKSDTYSFGVVLLEIISGHKAYDATRGPGKTSLAEWVHPLLEDRENFLAFADPKLNGQFRRSDLWKAVEVASLCVRTNPNARPNMREVIRVMAFMFPDL